MDTIQAEGTVHIHRSPEQVFAFLCNPNVDPAALTPMEDRFVEWQEMSGVGSICRSVVEFAARELNCTTRCTEYEPPHRLATRMEGDLVGAQNWRLSPAGTGTELHLSLSIEKPIWLPSYLRDETTAERWGEMLVEQTLENVRSALQQ